MFVAGSQHRGDVAHIGGIQGDDCLLNDGVVQAEVQRLVPAQTGAGKVRIRLIGQIAVHRKAVVGVVFQGQQILGGDLAAADHQNMAKPFPPVPAASAVPPHDQSLDHQEEGCQQIEQDQHHAGEVGEAHLVQNGLKGHNAHKVHHRDDAALAPQPVKAGIVIQA